MKVYLAAIGEPVVVKRFKLVEHLTTFFDVGGLLG